MKIIFNMGASRIYGSPGSPPSYLVFVRSKDVAKDFYSLSSQVALILQASRVQEIMLCERCIQKKLFSNCRSHMSPCRGVSTDCIHRKNIDELAGSGHSNQTERRSWRQALQSQELFSCFLVGIN